MSSIKGGGWEAIGNTPIFQSPVLWMTVNISQLYLWDERWADDNDDDFNRMKGLLIITISWALLFAYFVSVSADYRGEAVSFSSADSDKIFTKTMKYLQRDSIPYLLF